jgi:hypothetical protein
MQCIIGKPKDKNVGPNGVNAGLLTVISKGNVKAAQKNVILVLILNGYYT